MKRRFLRRLWVYILKCSDGTYYTGVTNNLERRLNEHVSGMNASAYTYSRRPLKLVYAEVIWGPLSAIAWEKQIKGWTRKKKEALIAENWHKLHDLAICRNETTHLNCMNDKLKRSGFV